MILSMQVYKKFYIMQTNQTLSKNLFFLLSFFDLVQELGKFIDTFKEEDNIYGVNLNYNQNDQKLDFDLE